MDDDYVQAGALVGGVPRGRGAGLNPGNRFEAAGFSLLGEYRDEHLREGGVSKQVPTLVYRDDTRGIINRVQAPSMGFSWSINPYRGCEHGCIYCFAREYHEMLGFSCGLDFETRIMAKTHAADLLRHELAAPSWRGEPIMMPTATDCYQPIEAKLGITRQLLEVLAQYRQPVGIVTKNKLVLRDQDLLVELARYGAVRVSVSLTTLDNQLAAKMEPRASAPRERLDAIRRLADAGVPVAAMVDPVIPGLTDRELPEVLRAIADAGAASVCLGMVRLPYQVRDLFVDWLGRHFPDRAAHVLSLMENTGCGTGAPPRRQGALAGQIRQVFEVFCRRLGLGQGLPPLSGASFRPPVVDGQGWLFEARDDPPPKRQFRHPPALGLFGQAAPPIK